MKNLSIYLDSYASCAAISLENPQWNTDAKIPSEPGWYYVKTNTPINVLQEQKLWASSYKKKRTGKIAKVANYDLAARAQRYSDDLAGYWNVSEVYSGMASNLKARAREHTFADPGTAGLALEKYPTLKEYDWIFGFITLSKFRTLSSCQDMMLRLGEQMWRAKNGWPLLCVD